MSSISSDRLSLTIIIPAHNESQSLLHNIPTLINNVDELGLRHLIIVDDASTDTTRQDLEQTPHPLLTILHHPKNQGQSSAIATGLRYARTDHIMLLDGDFQIGVDTIKEMIREYNIWTASHPGSYLVLKGERTRRPAQGYLEKIAGKVGNRLLRQFTGLQITDFGCTTAIYPRELLRRLPVHVKYFHRYLPIIARSQAAGNPTGLEFKNFRYPEQPRKFGQSHYRITKSFGVPFQLLNVLIWTQRISKQHKISAELESSAGLTATTIRHHE